MGTDFQFGKMKMDGGDSYTTMWVSLMLQNCTLKNGYSGKFYVCFTKIVKKKKKKLPGWLSW